MKIVAAVVALLVLFTNLTFAQERDASGVVLKVVDVRSKTRFVDLTQLDRQKFHSYTISFDGLRHDYDGAELTMIPQYQGVFDNRRKTGRVLRVTWAYIDGAIQNTLAENREAGQFSMTHLTAASPYPISGWMRISGAHSDEVKTIASRASWRDIDDHLPGLSELTGSLDVRAPIQAFRLAIIVPGQPGRFQNIMPGSIITLVGHPR